MSLIFVVKDNYYHHRNMMELGRSNLFSLKITNGPVKQYFIKTGWKIQSV